MLIDSLNLNLLRIFESVYRNKNMTKASFELHMTQSGVSQNIKNLEEILGVTLFDRVKKRPIPTAKANELYESCRENLYSIEEALGRVMGVEHDYSGPLTIGLPLEYGNNIVLPLLSEFNKLHSSIIYRIEYGHAATINQMILKGEIDFAIVDSYGLDKEIKTEFLAKEELVLCCSKEYMNKKKSSSRIDKNFFESLDYISYMEGSPLVKSWFSHHYQYQNINVQTKAILMNAQGISQMVISDLGVAILPLHMVNRLKESGEELHVFRPKAGPLLNTLSIAYLDSKTMNKTMSECIKYITKALKN
jgi:DNA-binding transcriptional LysR family regulator